MATVTDHTQRPFGMTEEEIRLATSDPTQAEILRMLSLLLTRQDDMDKRIAAMNETLVKGRIDNVTDDNVLVRRMDKIEQRQDTDKEQRLADKEAAERQSASNKWLINLTITIFGIIAAVMMGFMSLMASHIQWVGPK